MIRCVLVGIVWSWCVAVASAQLMEITPKKSNPEDIYLAPMDRTKLIKVTVKAVKMVPKLNGAGFDEYPETQDNKGYEALLRFVGKRRIAVEKPNGVVEVYRSEYFPNGTKGFVRIEVEEVNPPRGQRAGRWFNEVETDPRTQAKVDVFRANGNGTSITVGWKEGQPIEFKDGNYDNDREGLTAFLVDKAEDLFLAIDQAALKKDIKLEDQLKRDARKVRDFCKQMPGQEDCGALFQFDNHINGVHALVDRIRKLRGDTKKSEQQEREDLAAVGEAMAGMQLSLIGQMQTGSALFLSPSREIRSGADRMIDSAHASFWKATSTAASERARVRKEADALRAKFAREIEQAQKDLVALREKVAKSLDDFRNRKSLKESWRAELRVNPEKEPQSAVDQVTKIIQERYGNSERRDIFAKIALLEWESQAMVRSPMSANWQQRMERAEKFAALGKKVTTLVNDIPAGSAFDGDRFRLITLAGSCYLFAAAAEVDADNWQQSYHPAADYAIRLFQLGYNLTPGADYQGVCRAFQAKAMALRGLEREGDKVAGELEENPFRQSDPHYYFVRRKICEAIAFGKSVNGHEQKQYLDRATQYGQRMTTNGMVIELKTPGKSKR